MAEKDKKKKRASEQEQAVASEQTAPEAAKAEENAAETAAEEAATPEETVLKSEFEELKNQSLRLAAEFDNYKKRTLKEKEVIYQSAIADTVKQLLPALDAIDSATALLTDEQKENEKGFLSVFQLMEEAVVKLGVEVIGDCGVAFDPNIHNAVMMEAGDGEHKIAQIFQKGYQYKERVIRAAMVKVTANQSNNN